MAAFGVIHEGRPAKARNDGLVVMDRCLKIGTRAISAQHGSFQYGVISARAATIVMYVVRARGSAGLDRTSPKRWGNAS